MHLCRPGHKQHTCCIACCAPHLLCTVPVNELVTQVAGAGAWPLEGPTLVLASCRCGTSMRARQRNQSTWLLRVRCWHGHSASLPTQFGKTYECWFLAAAVHLVLEKQRVPLGKYMFRMLPLCLNADVGGDLGRPLLGCLAGGQ